MKKSYLALFALITILTLFLAGCSQTCPTIDKVYSLEYAPAGGTDG